MFKLILLVIVVLITGLLVFAATRPDTLRVQRTTSIKAPPEKIFALINDFQRWRAWSPYENRDPAMKRTLGATTSGKGAVYEWDGNKDVGKGRMEITESSPSSRVAINLDFIKPLEAHNVVEFTLVPHAGGTNVAWDMRGPMPYISKLMSVFIDMDRMIGKDFEAGLASLKTAAEM